MHAKHNVNIYKDKNNIISAVKVITWYNRYKFHDHFKFYR